MAYKPQKARPASVADFLNFGLKSPKKKLTAFFPYKFTDYQQHFLDNFNMFNLLLWGRRAGKDVISFYKLVTEALEHPGKYYYIFPCMRTGKSVVTGFGDVLGGMCDYLPSAAIKNIHRSGGVIIHLFNGSTINLVGVGSSQQNRALRGDNIKGVIFSEYAYYSRPEEVFTAVVPALTRTKGWAIFASTPKADSHLTLLYETMQGKRGWYVSTVTQRDNHYLTEEEFSHASLGLTKSAVELEFNCNYSVPDAHSVFFEQLNETYVEEGEFQYQGTPVFVAMDLGLTDSDTVFWWCTKRNNKWIFFDYFEAAGQPFIFYVRELERRKLSLKYMQIFVPHDIVHPEFANLETRLMYLQRADLPLYRLPKVKVMDSIDRTRLFLEKNSVFFSRECERGLSHLKNYAYKDALNTIPDVKSRHSHATDAFRYLIDGLMALELM